jgi:hypothetical protein
MLYPWKSVSNKYLRVSGLGGPSGYNQCVPDEIFEAAGSGIVLVAGILLEISWSKTK